MASKTPEQALTDIDNEINRDSRKPVSSTNQYPGLVPPKTSFSQMQRPKPEQDCLFSRITATQIEQPR